MCSIFHNHTVDVIRLQHQITFTDLQFSSCIISDYSNSYGTVKIGGLSLSFGEFDLFWSRSMKLSFLYHWVLTRNHMPSLFWFVMHPFVYIKWIISPMHYIIKTHIQKVCDTEVTTSVTVLLTYNPFVMVTYKLIQLNPYYIFICLHVIHSFFQRSQWLS